MREWLAKKGARLLVMVSERRRLATYTDSEAHRRVAPERDGRLPVNHTRSGGLPPFIG
ncbi:MAG: hypothetical protein FWE15_02270 [Actinomycetia bacterium]|nr:hypothetical protein [Actinomycetes bacterium]